MTLQEMMEYYPKVVSIEDECELTILRNEVVARFIFEAEGEFTAEYNKFITYFDKRIKMFHMLHKEHIHVLI
jgi:hypothetical protein